MHQLILKIYDYMTTHRMIRHASCIVITLLLVALVLGQSYKEDISDFLPLNNKYSKAMDVYQEISGANRLFIVVGANGSGLSKPDSITEAIQEIVQILEEDDSCGITNHLMAQVDLEKFLGVSEFAYNNIPYFLTDEDYYRFDSLLHDENYISDQLTNDKQMLMFPASNLLSENMQKDPLNLFTPIVSRLQNASNSINYEIYDGYIFAPDMSKGIIMLSSPYGASETENNTKLLKYLESVTTGIQTSHPGIEIHTIGGPAIAVGNSKQIKSDSFISIIIAVFLIVCILYMSFRSIKNMMLIIISIAWGWLFAMGWLYVIHDNISVIVMGISSIILGIAVNYPLHLIAHLNHTPDIRNSLKEIVTPLVVGNITTVGAFLALVPLNSQALRDLGYFSSLLLIGTIIFVLIYLPHSVSVNLTTPKNNFTNKLSNIELENKNWIVVTVVLLTVVLGYYSFRTSFDPNISHINYMTSQQKEEMQDLQSMITSSPDSKILYMVYEADDLEDALDSCFYNNGKLAELYDKGMIREINTCFPFVCSNNTQEQRLYKWNDFIKQYRNTIEDKLKSEQKKAGFAEDSFNDFLYILNHNYIAHDIEYFKDFYSTAFPSCIRFDSKRNRFNVIDQITVSNDKFNEVCKILDNESDSKYNFDIESMNSSIANSLSDDFNYIGWACGFIVFFFLWLSFGSFELAVLSFLPMALSWIWILGIMSIFSIQFNVINVILATFIFGQGDDYTIFITEGCQYEYTFRKKMVSSYKNSIILSAIIMFIGIGSLIFAKHPALHSLAEVTIIGMFSVVLMAYLVPPFIFKWLVSANGKYRIRPISINSLFGKREKGLDGIKNLVIDRYRYKGYNIVSSVKRNLRRICFDSYLEKCDSDKNIIVINNTYGEFSLLLALAHPEVKFMCFDKDEDNVLIARYSAEQVATNITIQMDDDEKILNLIEHGSKQSLVFILKPNSEDMDKYKQYKPIIIE